MLGTEQVEDGLHGIEGDERNLDEDRVPVAHRAVPQTGQLLGLQRTALVALAADETGLGIHEPLQIEFPAQIVRRTADHIHRIEMRRALEHGHCGRVVHVELGTLENLQGS